MFTGTLRVTRREAQDIVRELGGIVGSCVNRDTDYLVVGEDYGGKFDKAGMLGITRVDEDYFWEMVEAERNLKKDDFSGLKGVMDEDTFISVIKELNRREQRNLTSKPKEEMSYFSSENLERFKKLHPDIKLYPGSVCPHCGSNIPYSTCISSSYCFVCKLFSSPGCEVKHGHKEWVKMGIETEEYICYICKDCETVKVASKAESENLVLDCDFVESAEYSAIVCTIYNNCNTSPIA